MAELRFQVKKRKEKKCLEKVKKKKKYSFLDLTKGESNICRFGVGGISLLFLS